MDSYISVFVLNYGAFCGHNDQRFSDIPFDSEDPDKTAQCLNW